ncbi:hypothetical protein DB347_02415 [Opitutaceae bacterium EW11]|nr:hypothetical protein DB347_02415 [Opitutaceae bacterium EW11]
MATNRRLRGAALQGYYTAAEWSALKDVRFDGYVILRGALNHDGSVHSPASFISYPDHSRDEMAVSFSKRIRLKPTQVGSHISPWAEIYVVFYESGRKPSEALVYGEQIGATAAARQIGSGKVKLHVIQY